MASPPLPVTMSGAAQSSRVGPRPAREIYAIGALAMGYAAFAILLNSVGPVILQSIDYFHITKLTASTLEAFKDLTIAVVSFVIAAHVPRIGFGRAIVAALGLAAAGCLLVPLANSFWAVRAMFFCVGFGFALMKVATYAAIGQISRSTADHARILGFVEALFMLAVVASAWIFAWFIDPTHPADAGWLRVYWLLAGICGAAAALVSVARWDAPISDAADHGAEQPSIRQMLALLKAVSIRWFVPGVFLYVFIEQGLGTWLPSINHQVLMLDSAMAVRAASAFALSIAAGRFVAGVIVVRTGWFALLMGCLGCMAALLVAVPLLAGAASPHEVHGWLDMPMAAWALPLIGFFMAPIYPTLNSVVLTSVSQERQAGLIGLIVVFSALGGTTGSRMVALLFSAVPGVGVLYSLLPPIALLALVVLALRRRVGN